MLKKGINHPKSGVDVGDHPPITPTVNIPTHLGGPEKNLYEHIAKMFLAAHSNDCIYVHSKLKLYLIIYLRAKPEGEKISFKISGNRTVEAGFTGIAKWLAIDDNSFDP